MIFISRHQREDLKNAMDIDIEENDDDEVDSIMDEDEPEPSEAEGEHTGEVDGDEKEGTNQTSKGKKSGCKSELNMAVLTDKQATLMALESNQLLHLCLHKWCYSEALNFICQVEEAAQIIFQLLGSMHKSEVLELMEFFRVANEYQLDSAEVSL